MADTFEQDVRMDGALVGGLGTQGIKRFVKTVTTADLTTAGTSQAVDVGTDDGGNDFPANAYVISGHIELDEVLAGGSISAATVQLGDTVNPDELLASSNVFTGATLGRTWAPGVYSPWTLEATAYAPELLVTTTGDNVDQATTFACRVIIDYWLPDAL